MISDTLSDAVQDIEKYLTEFPDTYKPHRIEIDALVQHMAAVLNRLDAAPRTPVAWRRESTIHDDEYPFVFSSDTEQPQAFNDNGKVIDWQPLYAD